MSDNFILPNTIYLYNEGAKDINFSCLSADRKGLGTFIKKNFPKIAVKVIKLKESIVQTKGLLFDLINTQKVFKKIVLKDKQACHIILTNKLFATYDEDKKLHFRAAIYSLPSIISLSGIVEGPAKPKDYYLYKERYTGMGIWEIEEPKIKKRFRTRFIDYGDRRINQVLKGYISQALFFYITGEPFCSKKECRLFNAHWQEDLIFSQIKVARFCPAHKRFLEKIRKDKAAKF